MDRYTPPADDEINEAVNAMLDRLGFFRAPIPAAGQWHERDELALRIGDALPARIHRMQTEAKA